MYYPPVVVVAHLKSSTGQENSQRRQKLIYTPTAYRGMSLSHRFTTTVIGHAGESKYVTPSLKIGLQKSFVAGAARKCLDNPHEDGVGTSRNPPPPKPNEASDLFLKETPKKLVLSLLVYILGRTRATTEASLPFFFAIPFLERRGLLKGQNRREPILFWKIFRHNYI